MYCCGLIHPKTLVLVVKEYRNFYAVVVCCKYCAEIWVWMLPPPSRLFPSGTYRVKEYRNYSFDAVEVMTLISYGRFKRVAHLQGKTSLL